MTHIASQVVTVEGRYQRQRCVWCGEILSDWDLAKIATTDGQAPGGWAPDALVTIDGDHSTVVPGMTMPDDCCALLEITR